MVLGALEAGGTKMVCAIGNEKGEILEQISIPTETPEITVPKLLSFFKGKEIEALGIGCFGPIDVDRTSETYGYITTTPKLAWQNCDIVGAFKRELGVPVGFDTDVNGSALGEYTWGIAKGLHSCIYITIGTGVGVGVIVDGNLIHGMMHPEGGHVLLNRHPEDTYEGFCPFHKNCLEGMAAGPAIEARWGKKGAELADRDEVWRPAPPSRGDGAGKQSSLPTRPRSGRWRRTILRRRLWIIPCLFPRSASYLAAASCIRHSFCRWCARSLRS